MNFEVPSGSNIETTDATIKKLEAKLKEEKNIDRYLTIVGEQENPWGKVDRSSLGQVQIKLVESSKRTMNTNEMMNHLNQVGSTIPGLKVFTAPIGIFGSANQSPIQMDVRYAREMATIEIEDTGPGLSKQERERIFEPFTLPSSQEMV